MSRIGRKGLFRNTKYKLNDSKIATFNAPNLFSMLAILFMKHKKSCTFCEHLSDLVWIHLGPCGKGNGSFVLFQCNF